jgi:hypothetical protein
MSHFRLRALTLLVFAVAIAASCGGDTPTTPSTTTSDVRSNETFSATLSAGQSQFYSFTTVSAGTTDVTLVSLRPAGNLTATLNAVVGLGLGTPQMTDCALSSATTTAPGLKTQVSVATNVSTYCVKIADIGNLRGAVDYTIRVVHP